MLGRLPLPLTLPLDTALQFLRRHSKPGGSGGNPAVGSDWAGAPRPALDTVSGNDVDLGLKAELHVQGPVGAWHRPVWDVNDDLLEVAECFPRVLVAKLEEFSEDEGAVEAVPLVVHGDAADVFGRALPEGGHHGGQLRGGNLNATSADEDDLLQGVGVLAAHPVDPVPVVGERKTEAVVTVDEIRDLGRQLLVGSRHGDEEVVFGENTLAMRVVVGMRIYRPASPEEVAVDSQSNLGWEAQESRERAWGLVVLDTLGDGAPLGIIAVALALVAAGVAHFGLWRQGENGHSSGRNKDCREANDGGLAENPPRDRENVGRRLIVFCNTLGLDQRR